MVLLFRDFYEKSYKVPMCSGVACVWAIFFALVIVAPWIACWRAGGKSTEESALYSCSSSSLLKKKPPGSRELSFRCRVLGQGAHLLRAPGSLFPWRFDPRRHGLRWPKSSVLHCQGDPADVKLVEGRRSNHLDAEEVHGWQRQAREHSLEHSHAGHQA